MTSDLLAPRSCTSGLQNREKTLSLSEAPGLWCLVRAAGRRKTIPLLVSLTSITHVACMPSGGCWAGGFPGRLVFDPLTVPRHAEGAHCVQKG